MQLRLLVVLFVATTELCEAQNKLHYRTLKRRARRARKLSAGGRCQSDMDCISGSRCSSCTSAQCEPCTSSPGRRLFGAPAGTMCECVASPPPDPRPPAPPPPPAAPPPTPPPPPAAPPPLTPLIKQFFAAPSSTWQQAEDFCNAGGGNLVSIHSADENAAAIAFMQDSANGVSGPYPWMGGYNSGSLSNTYWSDGTPFDYNPGGWGIDDPKMHYYTSGSWGTWCSTCNSGGICQRWVHS